MTINATRLLAVCLLTALGSLPPVVLAAAPAEDACKLTPYGSVAMNISPAGLITIPAKVNGRSVRLGLNSAGDASEIGKGFAAELGLPTKRSNLYRYSKTGKSALLATVDNIELAGVRLSGLEHYVQDSPTYEDNAEHDHIVGALHLAAPVRADVELDFKNRRLTLWSTDHCKGRVVHWADRYSSVPFRMDESGGLYFPMDLDGRWVYADLATGRSNSILDAEVSKALYGFDEKSPGIEQQSDEGGQRTYFRAMTLATDGLQIRNARIRVIPVGKRRCGIAGGDARSTPAHYRMCNDSAPLSLGMNVLSKLHLYIAHKEKVLYFTAADATHDPP